MSNKVIVKTANTALVLILLAVGWFSYIAFDKVKEKLNEEQILTEQLKTDYQAYVDSFETYQVFVGDYIQMNVAKAYRATVELDKWKEQNKEDAEIIKALKIKNKNLQSVTHVGLEVKDTVPASEVSIVKGKPPDRLYFGNDSSYMKAEVAINYENPIRSELAYRYRAKLLLTNEFQQKTLFWGLIKLSKKYKTSHIVSKDQNCEVTEFEYKEFVR